MKRMFKITIVLLLTLSGTAKLENRALAQESLSFEGKSVSMIIGYSAGGGTDTFGRILAPYLTDTLPGKPAIVIRNMPGAAGIVALNAFVTQFKPDGLTLTVGSGTQVDPFTYRIANAKYDLTKFEHIGGAGRSGTVMLIDKNALPRLLDKSKPPVVMGALTAVRSGMIMTLWGGEFLGWNVKWVTGYQGAKALQLGLVRREIDMTSFGRSDQIKDILKSGEFEIIAQSGMRKGSDLVSLPDHPDVPVLGNQIVDKLKDPLAIAAFNHWKTIMQVGQWLALPPGTPKAIVENYRSALRNAFKTVKFREQAKKVDPDMVEMSGEDMLAMVTLLAQTPPEALTFMETIAKKQGLAGLK